MNAEPVPATSSPTRRLGILSVTALFVLLTAFMTWPQAIVLKTHALDHIDVFFNLWRLRWVAHALSTSPTDLFNANVFHPDPGVLAYSDAMLLQGVVAAPLFWAGVPPMLVHNLLLLGAIVASAVGIFVLARHVSGSEGGALVAGVVFAFAPYRFEHYMHMELQWTIWSPWALWAAQRAIETGARRFGLLTGLFVSLQMLSSVYYGVFLLLLLPVVVLVQLIALPRQHLGRVARALVLGGALAASASWIYSLPYSAASARVGTRGIGEVRNFSAEPGDYLVATPANLLYGSPETGALERRLFPGILPPLLALFGLVLVRPSAVEIASVMALVMAFELSMGLNGWVYPWLSEYVGALRGLRAWARASMFCLLFLGVLAAHGTAVLTARLSGTRANALAALICAVILLEYHVGRLPLVPYPNDPPPLYRMLSLLPPGSVIEFPVARPDSPPNYDPRFAYMSTFHWKPLLNGYSGFYPPSYFRRLVRLAEFPEGDSVPSLRREKARYVIVHDDGYPEGERRRIVERLSQLGLKWVGDFEDGWSIGTVMELN